ncbi:hypothetical protein ACFQ4O_03705 [Methylopila musalis]|uniref:Lipoprotein n=1 Tax=Methylopila musalis TaxID=1134781 RepID=A0ABW3Z4A8_9HYPH
MSRIHLVLAVAGLGLAGCAVDPAQQRAMDIAQCREYGMRPGTEAFATCRMTLDVERKRERSRRLDDLDRPYWGPYGAYGRW